MKLGLIYAMPTEIEQLLTLTEGKKLETVSGVSFYALGENIIAAHGGVGKVNAAMAAQLMIDRYAPEALFNAGIAGTLEELPPYSMVLASSCMQYDVDTSGVGDPVAMVSTVNRVEFPCAFPEKSRDILRRLEIPFAEGLVASGDWFAVNGERARSIKERFHPLILEMEACAIAQVAYRAELPFMALKLVSDRILREAEDGSEYHFNYDAACRMLAEKTLPFLRVWAEAEA